tara:strand:- start:1446 stop:1820 length:375 start_codon:yes stop_codon:yes gene_type:complete
MIDELAFLPPDDDDDQHPMIDELAFLPPTDEPVYMASTVNIKSNYVPPAYKEASRHVKALPKGQSVGYAVVKVLYMGGYLHHLNKAQLIGVLLDMSKGELKAHKSTKDELIALVAGGVQILGSQ